MDHQFCVSVVAPTGRDGPLICEILERQGFSSQHYASVHELCCAIKSDIGAIVVTEEALLPGALLELDCMFEAQPAWSDLAMILLTSNGNRAEAMVQSILQKRGAGSVILVERPVRVLSLVTTIRSVLQSRTRQYEVRDYLEERARQVQLKDEFLALLGHELRNPLAAISTALHLLFTDISSERHNSLQELIRRQVGVLRRLVDDLLDVARISQGQVQLKKDPVDLAQLLQSAIAVIQSAIDSRGQEMILRLPAEHVRFMADGVRMEQVVVNLLSNASKYTDTGGKIELSGAREGSEVVIQCRDNGAGIPAEMQKAIFGAFTRLEAASESRESGVGLGLTLVKRLVELHGGTVSVKSGGPGAGSEFTVRLPLVEAPRVSCEANGIPHEPRVKGSFSIVVVEDNRDVAQTLTIALKHAGHRVRLFTDGPSALSGIARLKPDAVLLDIGLPGMDGYELAAKLRKKRNLKHTLFVGLSGFKRRAREGEANGNFDHYFVKPLDLDALLQLLNKHVRSTAGMDQERGISKSFKTSRVLLVEDNAELADVTAEMLREHGLEVTVAHSGREALHAASGFRPQLILCDLRLPDMSGKEVVQALRLNAATRPAHAVILTALSEVEIRTLNREAKLMGVDKFISKPLRAEMIHDLLVSLEPKRTAIAQ